MERSELKIIQELMESLCDEMEYNEDDLGSRLGRKKPEVSVVQVKGESPLLEKSEEKLGMDLDGDEEMGESPEHAEMVMGEEDPEEMFKKRVMKLRG